MLQKLQVLWRNIMAGAGPFWKAGSDLLQFLLSLCYRWGIETFENKRPNKGGLICMTQNRSKAAL